MNINKTPNLHWRSFLFVGGIFLVLGVLWFKIIDNGIDKAVSDEYYYGDVGAAAPPPAAPPTDEAWAEELEELEPSAGPDISAYPSEDVSAPSSEQFQIQNILSSIYFALIIYSALGLIMIISFMVSLFHPDQIRAKKAGEFCNSLITFFAGAATQIIK